jgi:hypothetical protein
MLRTAFAVLAITLAGSVAPAAADNDGALPESETRGVVLAANLRPLAGDVDWSLPPVQIGGRSNSRGVLPALYLSLAGLNAFDAYSTTRGLAGGATESNPLMKPMAGNPAVLWAVKGAVTATSIVMAERLWKSNRKAQAVAVMVISNGMMAMVAARNASVLRK